MNKLLILLCLLFWNTLPAKSIPFTESVSPQSAFSDSSKHSLTESSTLSPLPRLQVWRYKGADLSVTAGANFFLDDFFHRDLVYAEDYQQAFTSRQGLSIALQLELPLNRSFRVGTGLEYNQFIREYRPPAALVNQGAEAGRNWLHAFQLPVYVAYDYNLGRTFRLGLAAGLRIILPSSTSGESFGPEYERIEFGGPSQPDYFQQQAGLGLYGALRTEWQLTNYMSLIGRIVYLPNNGNELNPQLGTGRLETQSMQFRIGFSYAMYCY